MGDLGELLGQVPVGHLLEFGVGSGGSITRFALHTERLIWGFDSFHGLPEAWDEHDGVGAFSLYGEVPQLPRNCRIVAGDIQRTLRMWLVRHPDPVAFCHFDMDIYSSTAFALGCLRDRLADGVIFVFDEIVGRQRNEMNEGRAFSEFIAASCYRVEPLEPLHGEGGTYRLWRG